MYDLGGGTPTERRDERNGTERRARRAAVDGPGLTRVLARHAARIARRDLGYLHRGDKRAPRPEDVYTAIAAHSVIGRCARDANPSTAPREMDVFSCPWPENRESLHHTAGTIMAAPLGPA